MLKLKKWNATRWLGRSASLEALCYGYQYVLDHLKLEMQNKRNQPKIRETAEKLYRCLTTYDNFLFFFWYRDVLDIVKRKSKQLQEQAIEVPDVGRIVLHLSEVLSTRYSRDLPVPTDLVGDGQTDNLLRELFGDDFNRKY